MLSPIKTSPTIKQNSQQRASLAKQIHSCNRYQCKLSSIAILVLWHEMANVFACPCPLLGLSILHPITSSNQQRLEGKHLKYACRLRRCCMAACLWTGLIACTKPSKTVIVQYGFFSGKYLPSSEFYSLRNRVSPLRALWFPTQFLRSRFLRLRFRFK